MSYQKVNLKQHTMREGNHDARAILRFLTCGSVDDGKSTLIGRLLYESKVIFEDHFAALQADSRTHGTTGDEIDFALLVDGLEAEREQGITIDVAYRFFSTPRRAFVVADTPGHEQYTRNMATGASNSQAAIILVDARKGILPQTKRHSYICSLMGIRKMTLAINKIDLVGYSREVFDSIVSDYAPFAAMLGVTNFQPIPISARFGDNVTALSARTPWYTGPPLLAYLETIDVQSDPSTEFRFSVQLVNRPNLDFRGYSGTVLSGHVRIGDTVAIAGTSRQSRVARIYTADGDLVEANSGAAVTILLDDQIDISRGDMLVDPAALPEFVDQFAAHILWMSEEPMLPGRSYLMRIGMRWIPASISAIKHRVDINTLEHLASRRLEMNEVGYCNISASAPVAFDPYSNNRDTGSFILVDRLTNETAGAGLIQFGLRRASNVHREELLVGKAARAALKHQEPTIIWFTGLSGSGKSTIAKILERKLFQEGVHTYMLDGDNLRHGLNRDLGFTDVDRVENIRRVGEVAKLFVEAGLIVICSFISPFRAERREVRTLVESGEFVEVFVDAPIEECIRRDPKGLYSRAKAGRIVNFTGIDSAYEPPEQAEIHIDVMAVDAEAAAEAVLGFLRAAKRIH